MSCYASSVRKCYRCQRKSRIQGICGICLDEDRARILRHPEYMADHGIQKLLYKKCTTKGCTFDALPGGKCHICQ